MTPLDIDNRRDLILVTESHFAHAIAGEIEAVIDRYDRSENTYVFVEGPRWSTVGFERIAAGWTAYGKAPFRLTSWRWTEGPFSEVYELAGFTAGIVAFTVRIGDTEREVVLRGTQVFRRAEEGAWRIVHEHFSEPARDPYGTGDWLQAEPPSTPRS